MDRTAAEQVTDLRDPAAFRAFYADMLPRIYSFVHQRCTGDVAAAEDVTQEAFTAAVREIRKGTVVRDPAGWMFGLARHKLLDHFRAQARAENRLAVAWQATATDDEWQPSSELTRERTVAALAAVPPSQRAALTLRYLEDMSVPQIADALGRSVHATESLLARGRDTFRRAYEECSDDD